MSNIQKSANATFLLTLILFGINAHAQINETFSDGNYTNNPAWTGDSNNWIINPSGQLQSNNTIAGSTCHLSTENTLATSTQWELYVRLAFNTSSENYADVYLTASAIDLASNSTTGYFVRIGSTNDDVTLYRKNEDGGIIKIIDGRDGLLNKSNNILKIKITRTANSEWTLLTDTTGTGNSYIKEDVVKDATYTTSAYFGIVVKQSTPSFFQKHFFDDIEIEAYEPDITPPSIRSVNVVSANTIDVLFSEAVDATTASNPASYTADNAIGNPVTAITDNANAALVHLTFATPFANGVTTTLKVNNVQDLTGNTLMNGTATFSFYIPQPFDVVMDEIFADPTPPVGLPEAEFIELKNTSGKDINLEGWRIKSLSATSESFPFYLLPADSFLIITSSSNASLFTSYGSVLGVSSFPSLNNVGTTLSLISQEEKTIHAVAYNDNWYKNELKRAGGWTLEMIDTNNPCNGSNNWKASTNSRGGTPGVKNSVDEKNPDEIAPALLRAATLDSVTVVLTFSEPVDSIKASNAANYSISEGIDRPVSAIATSPASDKVRLTLATPLHKGKVYTITASNIADCSGNIIRAVNTARVGLASAIDSLNIIINELLFNPKPTATDYVEIYNRSDNVFDLNDLYIANRSGTTGALGNRRQISADNLLIFPGDFYVISENGALVKQNYVTKNPDHFIDVTMPSFPDNEGTVVILNAQGLIVDELHYSEKWHFELIDNEEGISLERADYNKPTQNKDNWHSAASTAGFGTPAYQNSQFRTDITGVGEIVITPKTFSPDNDGFEDFTTINYQISEPGFVGNITIFDAVGRPVKALAKNATLAFTGSFRWDGLNDKLVKVPVGTYVVYTEMFNLNGKKKSFKNTVVVARRF